MISYQLYIIGLYYFIKTAILLIYSIYTILLSSENKNLKKNNNNKY